MKKNYICIIVCILLVSCINNTSFEGCNEEQTEEAVSLCIKEAFDYYLKLVGALNDSSVYYMVEFGRQFPTYPDSDTMITIGKLNSYMSTDGLKGMTLVCNRKIIIFDEYGIGGNYYKMDSLEIIDTDSLFLPNEMSLCCSFTIEGCYLRLAGIPPSDYEAIKIR